MNDDPAYLLRFGFLESLVDDDPHLVVDPAAIAALRGLSLEEYERICAELDDGVQRVAAELLSDPVWRQCLRDVPWRGKRVVALGDSMTADLQSWARILAIAVRGHEAHAETRMTDLAVDGDTSASLLSRLAGVLEHDPDHVLVMIGTNDGQGHLGNEVSWLSDEETRRNLAAIVTGLEAASATVTWLAPPRLRFEDIEGHWYLGELPIGWSQERHEAKRQIVLEQRGFTYDTAPTLDGVEGAFLDGLHPSLNGHRRIAEGLVNALATPA